jgi:hypothetical protein
VRRDAGVLLGWNGYNSCLSVLNLEKVEAPRIACAGQLCILKTVIMNTFVAIY